MSDRRWLSGVALILGACASAPPPSAPSPPPAIAAPAPAPAASQPQPQSQTRLPHYRCDGGIEFDVRFEDGSAQLVFASRPPLLLLRDAGGTSPQHVVYSSTEAKAEFGLGDGREAKVHLVSPATETKCTRN